MHILPQRLSLHKDLYNSLKLTSMKRIFCLETEWDTSLHALKSKSTVQSLLGFFEESLGVPYVFRQVATLDDFDFYISHLENPSYDAYDIVYLCFHGMKGGIAFADESDYSLVEFAEDYKDIFKGRTVIFDCCSTLGFSREDALYFKRKTGARVLVGYTRDVKFVPSFVFEFWLLNAMRMNPDFGAKRLMELAENEMPVHVKKLGFITY